MRAKSKTLVPRSAMTAVEVLVATMLSALLMVAIMGTLRGLKAHERALNLRDPTTSWQRTLTKVLDKDFNSARTIRCNPQFLELEGYGGRSSRDANGDWLPLVIRYEIVSVEGQNWLVRKELQSYGSQSELVSQKTQRLQFSLMSSNVNKENESQMTPFQADESQPLKDGLCLELFDSQGRPRYQYVYRQL